MRVYVHQREKKKYKGRRWRFRIERRERQEGSLDEERLSAHEGSFNMVSIEFLLSIYQLRLVSRDVPPQHCRIALESPQRR